MTDRSIAISPLSLPSPCAAPRPVAARTNLLLEGPILSILAASGGARKRISRFAEKRDGGFGEVEHLGDEHPHSRREK